MKLCYWIVLFLSIGTCKKDQDADRKLIASLGSELLYEDMLPEKPATLNYKKKNKYAHDWAKDVLLTQYGTKEISDKQKIKELVQQYENELILSQIKSEYIAKNLNSSISEQNILDYFNENEASFINHLTYLRVQMAKIPSNIPDIDEFNTAWLDQDSTTIIEFCERNNGLCLLNADTLISKDLIASILPQPLHKALKEGENLRMKSGEFEYFVKTLEVYDNDIQSALEVHRSNIIQSILYKRKQQLLINLRDSLFNQAIEQNKLKMFINE